MFYVSLLTVLVGLWAAVMHSVPSGLVVFSGIFRSRGPIASCCNLLVPLSFCSSRLQLF